jgi:ATP-dependent DNA helicase RecG
MERIESYQEALQLRDEGPMERLLLQRGCARQQDGDFRPTYAGLLLFGRYPQRWLPSAKILVARFPGTSVSDQFVKQDIGGTLPEQLRQAIGFVHDNMRSVVRMVGLKRKEALEYPVDAIRELLVNAVAHRDYNQQGDSIHLHIFSDRLEVRSPGGLPGPVNLDNLLEARFSRNPVISQVLSDLGFVERLGYGLNRVVTILRQQGQPDPRFEEFGGSFRVTLYPKPESKLEGRVSDFSKIQDLDLNPRQELAINYLSSHRRITNRAYQELCPQVSSETIRRDLADMVSKGVLLKIGDKRATYYILKH